MRSVRPNRTIPQHSHATDRWCVTGYGAENVGDVAVVGVGGTVGDEVPQ
ncbi:hypothetical protein JOF56_007940 [Kibdelosporangium banguiense]|uniref:Uncharacterized protein n=1 Tax=Kibdelosporangium banguiense TaxID=1365924 RepID=A0ABS4TT20_9PSEU|nr:hypothetical protein [Kibdelosporangium banguiense]MBP2327555.1 hypothetical protein [Kibdelosporangium banguiense]